MAMPAGPGEASAEEATARSTSLAKLLTGHILQDGELVLLILKPSRWLILFDSMKFAAVVLIVLLGLRLWPNVVPERSALLLMELGALLIAGRVMWSVLQWMGRLFILTDLRIVRLSGVFHIDVFDCPLRRVARVRVLRSFRERLLRLGTIEIIPQDENLPISAWQTIKHPQRIHDQIIAAINRAKQRNLYRDAI
jgi:hypothetical protein